MITQKYLKSRLSYCPTTGYFTSLGSKTTPQYAGKRIGTLNNRGYISVYLGTSYQAHRLAFLYMTGEMPEYVDHINRDTTDNRWENLRPATISQNNSNTNQYKNNTSGYRGVSWNSRSKKWQAQIRTHGKLRNIGFFSCKHNAFCEYVIESRSIRGDFSAV